MAPNQIQTHDLMIMSREINRCATAIPVTWRDQTLHSSDQIFAQVVEIGPRVDPFFYFIAT